MLNNATLSVEGLCSRTVIGHWIIRENEEEGGNGEQIDEGNGERME